MMRLDKYLAHANWGTRREVKKIIRAGHVYVNGECIRNDDFKIDENKDEVYVGDNRVLYQAFYYLMLHKPQGYVSATMDKNYATVLDLIEEDYALDLFPVGRLDLDTEGLLILTNDGPFAHSLLSPKKHVDKQYYVTLEKPIQKDAIVKLEAGIAINNEEECKPAQVEMLDETHILLTIQEGKYHQVKRMMHAVQNEVLYLKRIRMGSLVLDETLELGQYRPLTEEEIERLKGEKK